MKNVQIYHSRTHQPTTHAAYACLNSLGVTRCVHHRLSWAAISPMPRADDCASGCGPFATWSTSSVVFGIKMVIRVIGTDNIYYNSTNLSWSQNIYSFFVNKLTTDDCLFRRNQYWFLFSQVYVLVFSFQVNAHFFAGLAPLMSSPDHQTIHMLQLFRLLKCN